MEALKDRHCSSTVTNLTVLDQHAAEQYQQQLDADWHISPHLNAIERLIRFNNYYETMAFVNAVTWVAHMQNHHPELTVSYNRCQISYTTHDAGGLTENDFICAARIDALLE